MTPAVCTKEFALHVGRSTKLLNYWKFDELADGDVRVDSQGSDDFDLPFIGGNLAASPGKINNGVGFVTLNRGLLAVTTTTLFDPAKGMTFFGWLKSTATNFTDGATLFSFQAIDAFWSFNFGCGLNNVNFNVNDGTSLEGISLPIVLGTWHFMRAWIVPSDLKFRFQLDMGAISTSATSFNNFQPATLANFVMQTKIFGVIFPKFVDEFGIYEGVLNDADAALVYNGGSGNTWPNLPNL